MLCRVSGKSPQFHREVGKAWRGQPFCGPLDDARYTHPTFAVGMSEVVTDPNHVATDLIEVIAAFCHWRTASAACQRGA